MVPLQSHASLPALVQALSETRTQEAAEPITGPVALLEGAAEVPVLQRADQFRHGAGLCL